MGYDLSLDAFVGRMNVAKEMTILTLVKEGLLSQENADYFLENYIIVEQGHESWGSRFLNLFKGTDKEGSIKFRVVKNIDIWNENKHGARPQHAKIIALKKEKEDAGAERFQDIGDDGGPEGTA